MMKRQLIASFFVIVMVAAAFTALAATTATPVAAHTQTKCVLTVSKTNPVIGERVTFTAQLLKWNGAAWVAVKYESTPQLKIGHYSNGIWYTDYAATTNSYGKIMWSKSWPSAGSRTYYALFGGDTALAKSISAGKTVTVSPPSIRITFPANNAQLSLLTTVRGTSHASSQQKLWVIVYSHKVGRYYPQEGPVVPQSGGAWSCAVYLGTSSGLGIGEGFDIIAVVANQNAHNAFAAYQAQCEKTHSYPGMSQLPSGILAKNQITVTRTS